ncbi:MAG: hypothetical protein ACRYFY_05705, partial [Janthinobacterium lividum]
RRAEGFLGRREELLAEKHRELGVTDELIALEVFSNQMLVALGEKGVKTLDDLADLAGDELVEILGSEGLDEEAANEIIMSARAHWFEGEDGAAAGAAEGDADEADAEAEPEADTETVAHAEDGETPHV